MAGRIEFHYCVPFRSSSVVTNTARPNVTEESRLGIWTECVPYGSTDEISTAMRTQGVRCEAGTPDAVTSRVEVVCIDGEATVHLQMCPTRVTIVFPRIRASVEKALAVRLKQIKGRTWRRQRLDRQLLSRIEAALAPFAEAEAEIEKAALLAKTSTPAEAEAVLKEWNRKYRKRGH